MDLRYLEPQSMVNALTNKKTGLVCWILESIWTFEVISSFEKDELENQINRLKST